MFDLKRPCVNCPFRRGVGSMFQLHPARLDEIKAAPAFQCHGTIEYDNPSPISKSLQERFWQKVDRRSDSECWEWTAGKDAYGYGAIGRGKRSEGVVKAHRLSWEMHYGFPSDGFMVLHECDNRGCVNPHHLSLGDNEKNQSDRVVRGRGTKYRVLTDDEVHEIRERYIPGIVSLPMLADEYGSSVSHIHNIVTNQNRVASKNDRPQQCAGLMAVLAREERPNQIMQVAMRLKALDVSTLDPRAEVYSTWRDVCAAHGGDEP